MRRQFGTLGIIAIACLPLGEGHAQQAPPDRVIPIVAERFTFTPSTITVDEGAAVELRMTSDDTDHGFRLVGPNDQEINVVIPKRGRGDVRVRLDTSVAGEYRFECSHVCGAGHSFMRGTVRVRPRPAPSASRAAETR